MKKSLLGLALMVTLASGAVYATINNPVKKQPANVYTYYLEGECDVPVNCSPEYTGPICSEQFEGLAVYNSPGCLPANEVTNILGRKQP
jgi:type 1 fimbria pilin